LVLQPADSVPAAGQTGTSLEQTGGEEIIPMFPEQDGKWRASVANIVRPTAYFLRARSARSRKFKIEVVTIPQIEETRFRITHPPYTRQPTYEGPLPAGGLAGLAGAEVRITIRSNRPLSSGRLIYVTGQTRQEIKMLPADASSATQVSGEFSISAN